MISAKRVSKRTTDCLKTAENHSCLRSLTQSLNAHTLFATVDVLINPQVPTSRVMTVIFSEGKHSKYQVNLSVFSHFSAIMPHQSPRSNRVTLDVLPRLTVFVKRGFLVAWQQMCYR